MILTWVITILAVWIETQILGIGLYYILVSFWAFSEREKMSIWPVATSGILLDLLSPRLLGLSSILAMGVFFLSEVMGMRSGSKERYGLLGILVVLTEGVVVGRSLGAILVGALIYLALIFGKNLVGAKSGGIVVRRKI
jgi:hypothetical protein